NRNAITIQIMAALIAYLLIRLASLRQGASIGLQALARLMPTLLFARRHLASVFNAQGQPQPEPPKRQIEFAYA
ncbi:MAG: hypothetical protein RLN99_06375, partial [Kiloniellaceae bacterium]